MQRGKDRSGLPVGNSGARPWLVLAGGDFVYKGVMAIYWVLLARVMSVHGLGVVALANAIAMPAYVIVDAGLTQMLVRDYSGSGGLLLAHRQRVKRRAQLGLFMVLPLAALGLLLGGEASVALAVGLMSLAYFFDFGGQLMLAPSRAEAVMEPDAMVRFIQAFGTVLVTVILIKAELTSPAWIVLASTLAYGVALFPAIRVWRRSRQWAAQQADPEPIETRTVTAGTILMTVFGRADSLIVQAVLGSAALAAYTVAYKLIEVARLVPGALARVVLAHSSAGEAKMNPDAEELGDELPGELAELPGYDPRDHLRTSVTLSALGTLALVVLGPALIGLFFGSDYENASGEVIRIMALSLIPFAIVTIGSTYTVGSGQAGLYWRIALESLVVMLILVPALALLFDLNGAAAGMLVSYLYSAIRFRQVIRPAGSSKVAF